MPAIIAVVGAMAVGAGTSVAFGYALEMTVGDKHYSRRDFAIDAGLGMVGAGSVKNVGKGAYFGAKWANKARKARKAGDTAVDLTYYGVKVGRVSIDDAVMFSRVGYGSSVYHTGIFALSEMLRDSPGSMRQDFSDRSFHPRGLLALETVSGSDVKKRSKKSTRPCRCKDGSYSVKCC